MVTSEQTFVPEVPGLQAHAQAAPKSQAEESDLTEEQINTQGRMLDHTVIPVWFWRVLHTGSPPGLR